MIFVIDCLWLLLHEELVIIEMNVLFYLNPNITWCDSRVLFLTSLIASYKSYDTGWYMRILYVYGIYLLDESRNPTWVA